MKRQRISQNDIAQHEYRMRESKWRATLELHMKVKRVMMRKGLYRMRVKCPNAGCEGHIHGSRARRNNHTAVWCDGTCGLRIVE